MKRIENCGWLLAVVVALTPSLRADVDDGDGGERSYQVIIDRNPFGVKPLPPPAPPAGPTNPPAKGTLKLTGFTTLGQKRAFFVWIDDKSKTNQPLTRAVGQDVDGLNLLEVDPVFRQVRVIHDGVEKLMSFATDGITNVVSVAAATGSPGVPGGQPGSVPGAARPGMPTPIPAPTVTPGTTSPGSTPGFRSIPSRNLRTQTAPVDQNQPIYAGASSPVTFNPVNTGTTPSYTPPPAPAMQQHRSAEEQLILMEAQRALNPNLPPTPGLPPSMLGVPR